MSKILELSAVLDALIECGKRLTQTAEGLRSFYCTDEPTQKSEETVPQKSVSLEDVRAVLAEKSRAGKTAAVKELLQKHGADRLSDIDPREYTALLADAEVI